MRPKLLSINRFQMLNPHVFTVCAIMMLACTSAQADLTFNWTADPAASRVIYDARSENNERGGGFMICNFPNNLQCHDGSRDFPGGSVRSFTGVAADDTTPFVQEVVEVAGVRYYHVIVGNGTAAGFDAGLAQGFAQEVYIRLGSNVNKFGDLTDQPTSASGGRGVADGGCVGDTCGNGIAPLRNAASVFTGNGTGNPELVIMRQVIKDGDLFDAFEKTSFNQKPKITQRLSAADLTTEFVLDMSNSDYKASTTGDNATRGIMINTLNLINPEIQGDFNMATSPVQNSVKNITGGLYTWAPGTNVDFGNSSGVYSDGNAILNDMKWQDFKN